MPDNLTTPFPAGTKFATKDLGADGHAPKNILVDANGADAMGEVSASPAANTLLGRLKSFLDRLPISLGPKAASGSLSVAPGTGTTFAVSAVELPLPIGAATLAKQDLILAAIEALGTRGPGFAITPHATAALERETTCISVLTAGMLTYRYPGESSDRTIPVAVGFAPIRATHIRATSTVTGIAGY